MLISLANVCLFGKLQMNAKPVNVSKLCLNVQFFKKSFLLKSAKKYVFVRKFLN